MNFSKNTKNRYKFSRRGFVALYAVLITSLLLAITLKMYDLAIKQQLLAAGSTSSHIAFDSADSGVECSMYWDLTSPGDKFPLPDGLGGQTAAKSLHCAGQDVTPGPLTGTQSSNCFNHVDGGKACAVSSFSLDYGTSPNGCSVSIVEKILNGYINGQAIYKTRIESRGYNVSCAVFQSTNPRTVERAIRIEY